MRHESDRVCMFQVQDFERGGPGPEAHLLPEHSQVPFLDAGGDGWAVMRMEGAERRRGTEREQHVENSGVRFPSSGVFLSR